MQLERELADGVQKLVESYVGNGRGVDAHDAELILQYQAQHIREEEGTPTMDTEEMAEWVLTTFSEDDKGDYRQNYHD